MFPFSWFSVSLQMELNKRKLDKYFNFLYINWLAIESDLITLFDIQ